MRTDVIDIVIPWVDGSDKAWIQSRNYWAKQYGLEAISDNADERFRDWDTIRFFFRSVSAYMPWVRKIHFVTQGHIPSWLNTSAPKLNIIKHEEFIPAKYLPTFSSHAIELNIHRIPGLADQFIYFNDDIIACKKLKPEDYFIGGVPCDYGGLTALVSSHRLSVMDTALTNIEIINDHFNKNEMVKKNFFKWFNVKYGSMNIRTCLLMPWKVISDFCGRHVETPFLKSTFVEVWEKEFDTLDMTCQHKFRTRRDVNQWLMRDWRLAKGEFIPSKPNQSKYYVIKEDNAALAKLLESQKYKTICINDVNGTGIADFSSVRHDLIQCLEEHYMGKSEYEI